MGHGDSPHGVEPILQLTYPLSVECHVSILYHKPVLYHFIEKIPAEEENDHGTDHLVDMASLF